MRKIRRPSRTFFSLLSATFASSQFWMMCSVLILIDQGFTFGTIAVATFMYSVVSACTEIPAGLIVDRLPRFDAVRLVLVVRVVVFMMLGFTDSTWELMAVWSLWGVSSSLQSGTLDAYVTEVSKHENETAQIGHIVATLALWRQVWAVVTVLSGGFLYAVNPSFPFLATAVLAVASLVLVEFSGSIPHETLPMDTARTNLKNASRWRTLVTSAKTSILVLPLPLLALAAVSDTFSLSPRWFFEPASVEMKISSSELGTIFTIFMLGGMVGAYLVRRTQAYRATWVGVALSGVSLLVMNHSTGIWLAAFVSGVGYQIVGTTVSATIQQVVHDRQRATALSTWQSASLVLTSIVRSIAFVSIGAVSLPTIIVCVGVTALVLVPSLLWLRRLSVRRSRPVQVPTTVGT